MMKSLFTGLMAIMVFGTIHPSAQAADSGFITAVALHGTPKYAPDFTHFDYVNPQAPRGGVIKLSGAETFDTFNAYTTKGLAAAGLDKLYVTLLTKSQDEAFSMYAALAQDFKISDARDSITFNLRPEAKWSDGKQIAADDVVWTFNTLVSQGSPAYRAYYANVKDVKAIDSDTVMFTFGVKYNAELPMIVGELPILPQHYWAGKDFTATTLDKPVTSGPYEIGDFTQGRTVTYNRVDKWWGADVPVFKGRYNFDQIVYEYYRDQDVALQAFFAGDFDFRLEYTAKLWATGYDVPAVKNGKIIKRRVEHGQTQGMQGFVLNQRRPMFQDIAVRKAINYAFDFEWSNKQFAYGAYTRLSSYFDNSELAARDLPTGRELEILNAYKDQLPNSVFNDPIVMPKTNGSGNNRKNLRMAAKFLDDAGYVAGADGVRIDPKTNKPLEFTFMVANTNAAFERWFGPYKKNLKRIGIKADIQIVDASQYVNKVLAYDFDMIVTGWGASLSPGNEQREFWGSDRADTPGGRNYIGVKSPVVDALIEKIVEAPSREELVMRTRALDRVLLNEWYVVPNWYIPAWRIAYWDKFNQPKNQAPYDLGVIDTWWSK